MHIRYNTTDKCWEYSNDMTSFFSLEENLVADADIQFGTKNAVAVDSGTFRRFNFEKNGAGDQVEAQIQIGTRRTGTTTVVGRIAFFNRNLGVTEKRTATLLSRLDGAQNSGTLEFFTFNAGTAQAVLTMNRFGSVLFNGPAAFATNATDGFPYIPSCAGVPTGTPTAQGSRIPLIYDTTNNRLYAYAGGAWRIH